MLPTQELTSLPSFRPAQASQDLVLGRLSHHLRVPRPDDRVEARVGQCDGSDRDGAVVESAAALGRLRTFTQHKPGCGSSSASDPGQSHPLPGIEEPASARVRNTVDAIRHELSAGGPLLYRYPPGNDGLTGGEGAFLPCSFWLVQALALTGRRQDALSLFESLVGLAGPLGLYAEEPLGLYAEEMDLSTRGHLGNYPQALTHAALVQAALALRATDPASSVRPCRDVAAPGGPGGAP